MVPTAKDTNADMTGLPAVFASRELIAACIGNTAPNASAIIINNRRDCILRWGQEAGSMKPRASSLFVHCLFRLYAERGVRDRFQSCFIDQLTGNPADAISLISIRIMAFSR